MTTLTTLLPPSKMDFLIKHLLLAIHDIQTNLIAHSHVGDFIEIGVYQGGTLAAIAKCVPSEMRVIGYDTFTGLPDPTKPDLVCLDPHARGDFADTSLEALKAQLPPHVTLVKGYYPDSAIHNMVEFAHLDVDFYEATFRSLHRLYYDLAVNGVVVVDDYNWPRTPGVKKAVDEFLAIKDNFEIVETAEHQIALRKLWLEV